MSYYDLIHNMRWSYSRLSLFEQCKYAFYLKYILNNDDLYLAEGNYYAEVGSYVHSILEKILNGSMSLDESPEYYMQNFDENVLYKTRQSTMDKTYETCANYFAELDLSWLKDYNIIGVEKKVETTIDGHSFIGFIDLLIQNKTTSDIVIVDHKSAAYPFKKDGKSVLKKSEKSFESYKKQMYLYANAVYQLYGKYPTEMWWNHFKDGKIAKIKFDKDDYDKSISWFNETIKKAEDETEFDGNFDFFHCINLCDFRNSCEYCQYNRSE